MKQTKIITVVVIMWIILFISFVSTPASAANCEALSSLKLENSTITSAQSVAAGAFKLPAGIVQETPLSFDILPAFCRVQGVIKPSNDSDIRFEVWLPASGWNGKYEGVGNGAFAGSISYEVMGSAIARNYATSSTDTGHQASVIDASWALGHPEKIIDFGYRAIHETAVAAKAIITAFYRQDAQRSYFNSCSNGGRQALMEVQRFPGDYDGIIAGAPANFWTHLNASGIWNMQAISDKASYINSAKLPAIQEAVHADCDMLDKVKDGVLEDPTQCRFNPSKLLCSGAETDSCLTNPQLTALKKIYDGPRNKKGDQIFPGYTTGGEAIEWESGIIGKENYTQSLQFVLSNQFFKNMVSFDPSWDILTSDLDSDIKVADDKLEQVLNATDPDLSKFRKRGGKLILYHGWNDAVIPPMNSVNYYQSVVSRMGQKESDEFIRLFMAPGMGHCMGGTGPDSFGQFREIQGDPEHDIEAALERWVEQGVPPNKIIATKYKEDSNPASGIVRTRPLCPYPQVTDYKGAGSTDDAANFTCVERK